MRKGRFDVSYMDVFGVLQESELLLQTFADLEQQS